MKTRALVLFGHGARDPLWAAPFQRLEKILQEQLPEVDVSIAFLELMEPKLPELVQRLVSDGCQKMTVVPIFFGQGGHVSRDLPVIIDQLKAEYPQLELHVAGAVGEDTEILNSIAQYCIANLAKCL